MCGTLLDTVIGRNMRRFIRNHSVVQHVLGVAFLVFTIGLITSHNTLLVFVYSLGIYAWFLVVSKLPGAWNIVILVLLLICFVLAALLHRDFTVTWARDADHRRRAWTWVRWRP
mgnify:CR=1 FL=1